MDTGNENPVMPPLRLGSLCTGYGGLDLAATAVFDVVPVFHAEVDPAAARVLEHRFPGVPNLGDITAVDWTTVRPVDVLCAGYPCQTESLAGQRKGVDDARWIWPSVAQAIRVLRPRVVFLENVLGHLSLGFRTVLGDLAELGFDAEWLVLAASDLGACHQRKRLFALAWPADPEGDRRSEGCLPALTPRAQGRPGYAPGAVAHRLPTLCAGDSVKGGTNLTMSRGNPTLGAAVQPSRWGRYAPAVAAHERFTGRPHPPETEPGPHGAPRLSPRFAEWLMGLPDGWVTDIPDLTRPEVLRILGNGVIPAQGEAAYRELTSRTEGAS